MALLFCSHIGLIDGVIIKQGNFRQVIHDLTNIGNTPEISYVLKCQFLLFLREVAIDQNDTLANGTPDLYQYKIPIASFPLSKSKQIKYA
uniref:Uncharacterized protein n=1 Tax=Angiostrongylus cantonensis TaxID=6313 RepID=A0A0K0DAQ9_ANGCA